MFQATRRRLALWYTTVTAVLLLLFAIGFYLYVRSTLIERIDDTLNHVVEVVQRSLVIEPSDLALGTPPRLNLEASFRNNADSVEDDHIDLEWFSPTGELLWSTFSQPLNVPLHISPGETVHITVPSQVVLGQAVSTKTSPDSAPLGQAGFNQATLNQTQVGELAPPQDSFADSRFTQLDEPVEPLPLPLNVDSISRTSPLPLNSSSLILRQVTQRVQLGRQVLGYLRASHPWFEVTKPTRQLVIDLGLGMTFMVGAVAAIGWLLSGLAIAPVRDSYQRLKQFTADASHELRNPLAVIQTNVQVALSDPDPDFQRDQLRVIERLTRRLGRLVDDLLFLARQDGGITPLRTEPVVLDELLQEVIEEQQAIATDKTVNLSLTISGSADPTDAYWVEGDRDQLIRLFTNLVSNAIQYTPPSGKIHLILQQVKAPNPLQLQVRVQDSGIGIPAEVIPYVFDRFYRVDPARTHNGFHLSNKATGGSGLGLAIAKVIVENHHGQIAIDSKLNQGTTFIVTLPQYKKDDL